MKIKQLLTYVYALALVFFLSSLVYSQSDPAEDEQYLEVATQMP